MYKIVRMRVRASTIAVVVAFLSVVTNVSTIVAAPPQLNTVIPRGWKSGANEVTLQGSGFTQKTQLLLDIPLATVALKPGAKPAANQIQFVVTIPPNVPPGVFLIRVAGEEGLSPSQVVVLDRFTNIIEKEPNNELGQAQELKLPTAIEGRLTNSESDWFAFDGKKGQRIVAEMAGRRLDCNIKPVLRLYDAKRLELDVARPRRRLGGDARIIATLPVDGRYYIELHDLIYRGDNKQYRLLIGDLQVADNLFPLGGRRGSDLSVQLSGGTIVANRRVPVKLDVPRGIDSLGIGLTANTTENTGLFFSPLPLPMAVGDHPEVVEQVSATPPATAGGKSTQPEKPQSVPVPIIVNGRILQPNETDRYQIAVTPEAKLRIFVESEQLGCPLDGVVQVLNEKGGVLTRQDDGPQTADPDFFYTVPKDVKTLVVSITDVHGRGGEEYAYRLGIEPAAKGDFKLSLLSPLVNIPAGGSASVRVRAVRRDFNEAIRLKLTGDLPVGLKISGAKIGSGATDTFLSLTASPNTPIKAGQLQIVGEAGPAEKPTSVRIAKLAKQPAHEAFPWLANRFVGAVTKPQPLSLEVKEIEDVLARGTSYTVKLKFKRATGQTGPIRLNAQTSHVVKPGQGRLAPQANLMIAENKNEANFNITVPFNAPNMPLSFIITAQLLDAKDKKTVVATVETASVNTNIVFPFDLKVASPPELKRGVRNILTAKLVRKGAYKGTVKVALTGLPGTIRGGKLTIPAKTTDFEIPLLVPPGQAAAKLANIKLTAVDVKEKRLVHPQQNFPLTIAAADPPAFLEIFEDGSDFVDALTEGPGTADIETKDVYSGRESISIQGEQKFRATLPGLNVSITEKPTAGQYRYIRFAWKKKGGSGAMLQLGVGNKFGMASPKGTDYRYLAGKDKYNSKAIKVADAIPGEWTVVTRDLFADHGPFTLSGISLTGMDGEAVLFDHIWLARSEADFSKAQPVVKSTTTKN